ncbi:MAG: hypothetical protein JWR51_3442 [Devosia sp.]|uniref:DNA/RNA non-specific endonuclease n=1 Tax=Devosia sp. TaxID=1871048 RepID=UPI002613166E|nr:DNA/RNA non-specific endonuclease [Devosia sp.]MDB5530339.1 hypothetical protein [Devosia sp.]
MSTQREDRIRKYFELIAGQGGVESVLAEVDAAAGDGSLESMAATTQTVGADKVNDARVGMEQLALGRDVSIDQLATIEAIIIPTLRPVYDVTDNSFGSTPSGSLVTPGNALWTKLSDDLTLKRRIEAALPAIGRIELPGRSDIPYGGTGFVVGPNLLMTNRHVAAIFARGLGSNVHFLPGRRAGVDFKRDDRAGIVLAIRAVRMIHPYWDMAILETDGLSGSIRPLALSLSDARELVGSEVVVVGYPAFDSRNPADVQDDLFNGRYGIKRMQPGLLQGGFGAESFGKIVPAATHDCSTLGGNSGSALVSLTTGEVVGLHFAGRYLERNYAVPSSALALDARVVDAGANFAGSAPGGPNDWGDWWRRANTAVRPRSALENGDQGDSGNGGDGGDPPDIDLHAAGPGGGGSVTFEVPLRITVSLGAAAGQQVSLATEAVAARKPTPPGGKFVPRSVADYADRKGYDETFLAGTVRVPMPEAADPAVLAPLKGGGVRLDYQNFSLIMHARRRLALVTASNVTEELALREPEPGRDYSRKGLFSERWFADHRLDAQYQLPDRFYSKDGGAFDKGHIVRRDDVAWGEHFDTLLKGNVDSFHVTNCSPQVAGYNRSDSGTDNWGDLENHVLSEAASERLCVFAGPVLNEDDRVFVGHGADGTVLRARIPCSFWKVVVARTADGIAAFGFVLEQNLADVSLEFAVAEEFVKSLKPLRLIENMAGIVFDASLHEADQHDTVRGLEVARRAGVRSAADGLPTNQRGL